MSGTDSSPEKGKKRTRNPEKWIANKRKQSIVSGEEYIMSTGKHVPARHTGPDCKCKKSCLKKFTDAAKHMFIDDFNKLGDKSLQDANLCRMIQPIKVKQHRPRTDNPKSRANNFVYKVKILCYLSISYQYGQMEKFILFASKIV